MNLLLLNWPKSQSAHLKTSLSSQRHQIYEADTYQELTPLLNPSLGMALILFNIDDWSDRDKFDTFSQLRTTWPGARINIFGNSLTCWHTFKFTLYQAHDCRLLPPNPEKLLRQINQKLACRDDPGHHTAGEPGDQIFRIKFPTQPEYHYKIFEMIRYLLDIHSSTEVVKRKFIIAMGETLENAVEHGNKQDPDKIIEMTYTLRERKITCTITDQGPGFDYKKHLAIPLVEYEPQKLVLRLSQAQSGHLGVGLGLIRKCVDEVSFNQTGNRITLIKYL